jgi:chitinase
MSWAAISTSAGFQRGMVENASTRLQGASIVTWSVRWEKGEFMAGLLAAGRIAKN